MTLLTRVARATLARVVLGLVAGAVLVLAGPAAPAAAHAVLVSSTPAAGAVVSTAPAEVVLTFSEPIRLMPDQVRVVAPDGTRADRGEPAVAGTVLTIPLGDRAPLGTYLVSYRVISADSHPVSGGIIFSVGAPSATPPDLAAAAEVPAVGAAVTVAKYLGYAGLALLVGPAVLLVRLWPRRLSRRGPTRLAWTGFGLVGAATVTGLWLLVPYTNGTGIFDFSGAALRDVLSTAYGSAYVVRIGVLAVVAVLLGRVLAGRASRADAATLGALGVVGLATWPVAGHPATSPVPVVSMVVGMIHVAGVAFWVGGLVVLAGFLLRRADERELEAILPAWSRWAALAVAALLLAGALQALIEVRTVPALVGTAYGRLVLAKIGVVATVVAVAAYSRHLVRTRAAPRRPGRLRAAVAVEAAILAGVLGLSAVLVQSTPARSAVAEAEAAAAATNVFSTTLDSRLYSAQVTLSPLQVGHGEVHVVAYTPEGAPLRVEEWRARVALPAAGIEPIDIPMLPLTDNHAVGYPALMVPGDWELRVTLRVSEIDQATVSVTVPIK